MRLNLCERETWNSSRIRWTSGWDFDHHLAKSAAGGGFSTNAIRKVALIQRCLSARFEFNAPVSPLSMSHRFSRMNHLMVCASPLILILASCAMTGGSRQNGSFDSGNLARATQSNTLEESSVALAEALSRAEVSAHSDLREGQGRSAYNRDVQDVVRAWQTIQSGGLQRDHITTVNYNGVGWRVKASWPDHVKLDDLIPAVPNQETTNEPSVHRDGVGVTFVAHWRFTDERKKQNPFLSEGGYIMPVTVTVDFNSSGKGVRGVVLTVHDPRLQETAVIRGARHPLAADFGAVGEYMLAKVKEEQSGIGMSGIAAMRDSEKYLHRMGLISLEPPSKNRIPVVLVHGLMSRPLTWQKTFNGLMADPAIRQNYQIYLFRYPTGVPVLYSAAKFRAQLAVLQQELARVGNHDSAHHMVLIGHSMGGLVSKMQLVNTGDQLWMNVIGSHHSDLALTKEEEAGLRELLHFDSNPNVDRVIFICTPHRGSQTAEGFVGAIGRSLIRLPARVLGTAFHLVQGEAPHSPLFIKLVKEGVPSSIDNLSPSSRFVRESTLLPIRRGVHVHSIIGNKKGHELSDPKCSDGVVPYSSSHLDGVESELVVSSDHGAHARAEAISEIRRILRLHLKTVGR